MLITLQVKSIQWLTNTCHDLILWTYNPISSGAWNPDIIPGWSEMEWGWLWTYSYLFAFRRLEMSIFLTGRDQSFTYTYVYAGDWSFYGSSCGLDINILWYILGSERLIFSINNLIIKRFFKKKDKWLWNISHSFAIFDIDLLQPVYYSMEINLFQPFW